MANGHVLEGKTNRALESLIQQTYYLALKPVVGALEKNDIQVAIANYPEGAAERVVTVYFGETSFGQYVPFMENVFAPARGSAQTRAGLVQYTIDVKQLVAMKPEQLRANIAVALGSAADALGTAAQNIPSGPERAYKESVVEKVAGMAASLRDARSIV